MARGDNGDDQIWKDIVEEVCKDADRLFKIIGEAYAVLSDPAKVFCVCSSYCNKYFERIYIFKIPLSQRSRYDSDEEMRNSQKKRHGNSMARNSANTQQCSFDQTDSRKQWKEVWRSRGSSSKDSEGGGSSRQ